MNSWHKFLRLSWAGRWLIIEALFLLPFIALALRLFGFRRLYTALANLTPTIDTPVQGGGQAPVQTHITARMVKAAASHGIYRANCLQHSLALWWLLRRRGIRSKLCIGVCKDAGRFEAHAWVEHMGVALNDSDDVRQRFTTFDLAVTPMEVKP